MSDRSIYTRFAKHWVYLALLFATVTGAALAMGWFGDDTNNKSKDKRGDSKAKNGDQKKVEDKSVDQEVFEMLKKNTKEDTEARNLITSELGSPDDKKDTWEELKRGLKSGNVNSLLNVDKDSAVNLKSLKLKDTILSTCQLRQYLHAWRIQLVSLRKAAQDSKIADLDTSKLDAVPTLNLLRELGSNRFKEIDNLDTSSKPSVLPVFTDADRQTADVLAKIFMAKSNGVVNTFRRERLGIDLESKLTLVDRLKKISELNRKLHVSFDDEMKQLIKAKLVSDKVQLRPCQRVLEQLQEQFEAGEPLNPKKLSAE